MTATDRNADRARVDGLEDRDVGLRVRQELRDALDVHQRHRAIDQAHAEGDEQRLRLRQGTARDDQDAVEQPASEADRDADQDRRDPGPTLSIIVTVTTATREMMPPMDRSRNPAMMTKVIPSAAKISTPNWRTMLSKLPVVRNLGSTIDVDDHQQGDRHVDRVVLQDVDGRLRCRPDRRVASSLRSCEFEGLGHDLVGRGDRRVELAVDATFTDRVDPIAHVQDLG